MTSTTQTENEAIHIAADEAFHGGFGAFKLVTKYDDEETANADYQHIEMVPIMGAASSVVFGAGAIEKSKRDAKQAWQLMRVNKLDAEEEYGEFTSFPSPVTDLSFDWSMSDTNKDVYIAHYYEIVDKTIHEYKFAELTITQDKQTYTDQEGNKLEREIAREWIDNVEHEKVTRKVKCVEYALMAGNKFLPSLAAFRSRQSRSFQCTDITGRLTALKTIVVKCRARKTRSALKTCSCLH